MVAQEPIVDEGVVVAAHAVVTAFGRGPYQALVLAVGGGVGHARLVFHPPRTSRALGNVLGRAPGLYRDVPLLQGGQQRHLLGRPTSRRRH